MKICVILQAALVALIAGFGVTACRTDSAPQDQGIIVAVTVPPLAGLVEQVGGDRVSVLSMVPPGASPHSYEPTPGQMALLSQADLYIKVGTPIEFELVWLDRMIALNRTMKVCDASDRVDPIRTEHGHNETGGGNIDPHIWLSARNMKTMIGTIAHALAAIDPERETVYLNNMATFSARLDSLDQEINDMLALKKQRTFIVYHSAWNYFARDYGLTQNVIEDGGKEPSARTIQRVIEAAHRLNIRLVVASPQFARKYAESIARDINGEVVLVDPLARDCVGSVRILASTLARYLE